MNTIKTIIGFLLAISMVGCITVDHIKMSDVSNFKSPNDYYKTVKWKKWHW